MSFLARLVPYIFLGMMLVVFVAGIIIFSYLLIFGAIVGLILFAAVWIRDKLLPPKNLPVKRRGRTIDHD